ncbi:MAG: hypothetical protein ABI172_10655 [Ginsengibacter sp.]
MKRESAIGNRESAIVNLFTIHDHSRFTIHASPFTIHASPFTIHHSLIHHSLCISTLRLCTSSLS